MKNESHVHEKGHLMWLSQESGQKYPHFSALENDTSVHFLFSYVMECGFSAVVDLLLVKKNRLEITKPCDLRLKLKKIAPLINIFAVNAKPRDLIDYKS